MGGRLRRGSKPLLFTSGGSDNDLMGLQRPPVETWEREAQRGQDASFPVRES